MIRWFGYGLVSYTIALASLPPATSPVRDSTSLGMRAKHSCALEKTIDDLLCSKTPAQRQPIFTRCVQFGPLAIPFLVQVVAQNGDSTEWCEYSKFANQVVEHHGASSLPYLYPMLDRPDPTIRVEALKLVRLFPSDQLRTVACRMRVDPDPRVRSEALCTLGRFSDHSAMPLVLDSACYDPDPTVRKIAILELRSFGAKAEETIPTLVHLLMTENNGTDPSTESESLGEAIGLTLASLGEAGCPYLHQLLADRSLPIPIRTAAMTGIQALLYEQQHELAEDFLFALIDCLKEPNTDLQIAAARTLELYGRNAGCAVPTLEKVAQETTGIRALEYGIIIARIQPTDLVRKLVEGAVESKQPQMLEYLDMRWWVARQRSPERLRPLAQFLDDTDPDVVWTMRRMIDDRGQEFRVMAAQITGKAGLPRGERDDDPQTNLHDLLYRLGIPTKK